MGKTGTNLPDLPDLPNPPDIEMPRDKVILECTECRNRNFFTDKNKRKHPERVERRKYCPRCDTHRVHKESK